MTERWLPVVGYEDLYEVSDLGMVCSVTRTVHTRNGPRLYYGRPLRQYTGAGTRGYPKVTLARVGEVRSRFVHHLVLEAFAGPCPEGQEARHGPGGKADASIGNLCWGTRSQNVGADRLRDGQDNGGDRNGRHKLTWDDVRDIRREWDEAMAQPHHPWTGGPLREDLARRFGVSASNIWQVVARKTWHNMSY